MDQRAGDAGPGFLRWRSWGSAPRRAFLLHDLGSSSATWWRVAEALATAGWRVKAPDLPAHGASPRADAPLTPARAAAWIAAELSARPIDLLVGHGFGGLVGLELRATGTQIDRLVVDGPQLDRGALAENLRRATDWADRDPQAQLARIRSEHPRWHDEDCRHCGRDLARFRAPEVIEGLQLGWPTPALGDAVLIDPVPGEVVHRCDPDEWLRQVLGSA